jgi:predicted SprT family Zn-dependent metalloprotease
MHTKEELRKLEEHILQCKCMPVILAKHNNDYIDGTVKYKCKGCDVPLESNIRTELYIDGQVVKCHLCSDERGIAILNMRLN